jgi:hypothetical protein
MFFQRLVGEGRVRHCAHAHCLPFLPKNGKKLPALTAGESRGQTNQDGWNSRPTIWKWPLAEASRDKPHAYWQISRWTRSLPSVSAQKWEEITRTPSDLQSRLKGKDRLAAVPQIGIGCGNQAERRKTDHRLLVALAAARLVLAKFPEGQLKFLVWDGKALLPSVAIALHFWPKWAEIARVRSGHPRQKRARSWETTSSIILFGIFFQKWVLPSPRGIGFLCSSPFFSAQFG